MLLVTDGADVSFAGLLTDATATPLISRLMLVTAVRSRLLQSTSQSDALMPIRLLQPDLTLNDFITEVQPYSVTMQGAANTFTQPVDFTNTGLVTLGVGGGDVFDFNGGLSFSQNAPSAYQWNYSHLWRCD